MPSKEENKLSFAVVMHSSMALVLQTKKSGCREDKSLPKSLWTSQPHADKNTCARLGSKRVLVAAVQVESLGLCSAQAEISPRCLQNWPEELRAGSLQLQAKQKTQQSFGWLQGQHLVHSDGWGLCGACLSCSQGSKAFQSPLKTFVQWGKIPAVVFETWAVSAAHAQLTR